MVYGAALALSVISLASLKSDRIMDFIDRDSVVSYNGLFLLLMGPVLVGSLVLFLVRYFTEPPAMRSIYGWMLLAAAIGVPAGILDLMEGAGMPGLRIANLGAIFACGFVLLGVLRNREFYDSLSRYREDTARLLSETKHGLVTVNAAGGVQSINRAGTRLLGRRPTSLSDIDPRLPDLMRNGGDCYLTVGNVVLKATMWPESVTGRHPPFYLLLEDATKEYELLHELAHRESLVSLGEAAATLAHEIKNPLTSISASAEALAEEGRTDPELVDILRAEVRRLDELVRESLRLARPVKVNAEDTDLNAVLGRIVDFHGSPLTVELRPAEALRTVRLDPLLLKQVVGNLLRNAEQAGAERVIVSTAESGEHAVITVENDGPPIPPEVKGRLFQPFVTTKPAGTGLGLAACAKYMKAHGGSIAVRNLPGGVTFELRFPWTF
jgi:nitrogen fixation/metabolism regulation signal transduction histidine kinase